jgi:sugar lactone lactonase YvrE
MYEYLAGMPHLRRAFQEFMTTRSRSFGEAFAPGHVVHVGPDGSAREVADDIAFPNGMAVTQDNSTLIVADSYSNRLTAFNIEADGSLSNRQVWAETGEDHPDGICIDAEGAVW